MKQIISKDDVAKAIRDLAAQGKKPTLATLHAALGNRGSMSTLVRLKSEIEAAAEPASDSPEGLKAFREIWALAVEEGRAQQQAVTTELRENLASLAAENERLEGTAMAANNRAAELQEAMSRVEKVFMQASADQKRELSESRTALGLANSQAAEALQRLSEVQATRAAETATFQSSLTAAVQKSHDLELKLVRAQALLEAKGIKAEAD